MSTQARKPAGSTGSTGGQFAPQRSGEADVDLNFGDPPPPVVTGDGETYTITGVGTKRLVYPNLDAELRRDTEHGLQPTSITTLYRMTGPGETSTAWVDLHDDTNLLYLIEVTNKRFRRTHDILGAARPDGADQ